MKNYCIVQNYGEERRQRGKIWSLIIRFYIAKDFYHKPCIGNN